MRATWYVLEDGSTVDPSEVTTNKDGALAHKNGLVAMRSPGVPRSRGVDPDAERAKAKRSAAKKAADDSKPAADPSPTPAKDTDAAAAKKQDEPKSDDALLLTTADMQPEPRPAAAKNHGYKTR